MSHHQYIGSNRCIFEVLSFKYYYNTFRRDKPCMMFDLGPCRIHRCISYNEVILQKNKVPEDMWVHYLHLKYLPHILLLPDKGSYLLLFILQHSFHNMILLNMVNIHCHRARVNRCLLDMECLQHRQLRYNPLILVHCKSRIFPRLKLCHLYQKMALVNMNLSCRYIQEHKCLSHLKPLLQLFLASSIYLQGKEYMKLFMHQVLSQLDKAWDKLKLLHNTFHRYMKWE